MKRGIAVVPTLLTLGNGFCGFLAISKMVDAIQAGTAAGFADKITQAAWLIFLAMIFDALDGRVARLTNQASEFGVQLDSLTDIVSFGVAPALLVKVVYEQALVQAQIPFNSKLPLLLSSLYMLCAVLRLARFSLDTDTEEASHNSFSGLPSPAAAGMLASSVFFLFAGGESLGFSLSQPLVLILKRVFIFIPPVLGLLMISRIPYVHMVNRYVRGRKTFNFLAQGILCLFLVAFCHDWAIFLFFTAYVASGPILVGVHAIRGRGAIRKKTAGKMPPR
jgi:CDP-diacylglycerol--serine O-phosphatidyltransferase